MEIVIGLLIKCEKTGRFFLVQRNDGSKRWALLSGGYDKDKDKSYEDCILREMKEELRVDYVGELYHVQDEFIKNKNRIFVYYKGTVSEEFEVILDEENLNWGWFSINRNSKINGQFNRFGLPKTLYPGLIDKIIKY